ncbi:MAG: ASCH domain-containing protein [Candidatus Paceibacterota bacterium]|jgi:hypothetical protein
MVKTIKFTQKLADEILAGRKTATWRLFDDKNLSEGDVVELAVKESLKKFADAKILSVKEKTLGQIEDEDYAGQVKDESQSKMLETMRKHYGGQVTLETPVKIIRFELIEKR